MKEQILDEIREYWLTKQPKPFIPGKTVVPVSGAVIDEQDISSVADALLDGWFTEWVYAGKFCSEFGKIRGSTVHEFMQLWKFC